jgi:hypothetical protein
MVDSPFLNQQKGKPAAKGRSSGAKPADEPEHLR